MFRIAIYENISGMFNLITDHQDGILSCLPLVANCHLKGIRTNQVQAGQDQTVSPPARNGCSSQNLNFCSPERAWIEVHNNCLCEDFTRNLRECYMGWILEYVIVTVFRILEFDNEAVCCVGLRMG